MKVVRACVRSAEDSSRFSTFTPRRASFMSDYETRAGLLSPLMWRSLFVEVFSFRRFGIAASSGGFQRTPSLTRAADT